MYRLYVGNLDARIDVDTIYYAFDQEGLPPSNISLKRGYALVDFSEQALVARAIHVFDGYNLMGSMLQVEPINAPEQGAAEQPNNHDNLPPISRSMANLNTPDESEHEADSEEDSLPDLEPVDYNNTTITQPQYIRSRTWFMDRSDITQTFVRDSHFTYSAFGLESPVVSQIHYCTRNDDKDCEMKTKLCKYNPKYQEWCFSCRIKTDTTRCKINNLDIAPHIPSQVLLAGDQFCRGNIMSIELSLVEVCREPGAEDKNNHTSNLPPYDMVKLGRGTYPGYQVCPMDHEDWSTNRDRHNMFGSITQYEHDLSFENPFWSKISWLFGVQMVHIGGDQCNFYKRVFFPALEIFFADIQLLINEGVAVQLYKDIIPPTHPITLMATPQGQKDSYFPKDLPALLHIRNTLESISKQDFVSLNTTKSLEIICIDTIIRLNPYRDHLHSIMTNSTDKDQNLKNALKKLFIRQYKHKDVIFCLKQKRSLENQDHRSLRLFHPYGSSDVFPNPNLQNTTHTNRYPLKDFGHTSDTDSSSESYPIDNCLCGQRYDEPCCCCCTSDSD